MTAQTHRRILRPLALLSLSSLGMLAGCSGRPQLADDSFQAWHAVRDAQRIARPSQRLAFIDADDAKIIVSNHRATYQRGGGGGLTGDNSSGFGSLTTGGGGLVNPVSILGAITGGDTNYSTSQEAAISSDR